MAVVHGFQLRIGLVLYGGSSLAVYMNGMTQELLALVRAAQARRLEQGPRREEQWVREWVARQRRENAYCQLLDLVDIDVVIDVIAGTSAGGLNGLVLGKALAVGAPDLTRFGRLWRDYAQLGDMALYDREPRAVLSGDYLQEQLQTVMAELSEGARPELAEQVPMLDLFVTATDLQGHGWVRYDRFHQRLEGRSHQYLFRLKKRTPRPVGEVVRSYARNDFAPGGPGQAGVGQAGVKQADAFLAQIGRATSAFPGIFPPVYMRPADALAAGIPVLQDIAGEGRDGIWFSDGGILVNAPFEPVLQTIFDRPASSQVRRVLVFVQPDPGRPQEQAGNRAEPGLVEAALAGVTLPLKQDILDKLDRLAAENLRRRQRAELVRGLDRALLQPGQGAPGQGASSPWQEAVAILEASAERPAPPQRGAAEEAYWRMRLNHMRQLLQDALARALEAMGAGAGAREAAARLVIMQIAPPAGDDRLLREPARLKALLEAFDMEYHARRLHYLLGRLHHAYRPGAASGAPEAMAGALEHLWAAVEDWRYGLWAVGQTGRRDLTPGRWEEPLRHLARALTGLAGTAGSGGPGAERSRPGVAGAETELAAWRVAGALERYIGTIREATDATVAAAFTQLDTALPWLERAPDCPDEEALSAELLRKAYAEFTTLDMVLFPLEAAAGPGGWNQIGLYGFRPTAASWVPKTVAQKLTGEALGHFAAFLDLRWRSNDLLWGRLDGAEAIMKMMAQETGRAPAGQLPPDIERLLTQRRRQIVADFPDVVDMQRLRLLATGRGDPTGNALPPLSWQERIAYARMALQGKVAPPLVAGQRPFLLEEVSDETLREYFLHEYQVGQEGLGRLPARRLAAEVLLLLDNVVRALGRRPTRTTGGRLQQVLTLVLWLMGRGVRLALLPLAIAFGAVAPVWRAGARRRLRRRMRPRQVQSGPGG